VRNVIKAIPAASIAADPAAVAAGIKAANRAAAVIRADSKVAAIKAAVGKMARSPTIAP